MIWDMLEDKFYTIIFFGIGIFFFFGGFMSLRRKRVVENIPTSTVRGMAMGLVELIGKAKTISKSNAPFKGPLSGADCAYYRFTVERLVRYGRRSHWEAIAKGDSSFCHFWLIDDTGRVAVVPKGADMRIALGYEFTRWGMKALPPNLQAFMDNYHLKGHAGYTLAFKEWHIQEGSQVYVLGVAKKSGDFLNEHKKKLANRLSELKKDPKKMAEVDLNKDGQISPEEWDRAVGRIEQELLEETLVKITAARTACIQAKSVGESSKAEGELGKVLKTLFAVAENYPDLKANQNFMQLQKRVSYLESQIADRREFYNDSVNNYNIRIHQIPDMFVAGMIKMKERELFKVTEEDKRDVDINFNFPK